MSTCNMQRVSITDNTRALMCDQCGAVTFELDSRFCPTCGARVGCVTDAGRDVYEAATAYAHDVGFDEGYDSAMQEGGLR